MFKKSLSVLLAVLMVVSVLAVGVVTAGAADYDGFAGDPGKLYFDAKTTGWDMSGTNKIGFYVFPLSDAVNDNYKSWGGKRLQGSDKDGDGIWEYDATPFKLEEGVQYKIIFAHVINNAFSGQTYDLFFDTSCLGTVAYCEPSIIYENPVDSSKRAMAAFWAGKDPTKYGPVQQVSSIGNVVGTCPEQGKTPYDIFVDFITVVNAKTEKTGLENSRTYVVEVGTKTEQKLIDDIGAGLGLTKDEIEKAFTENGVDTVWTAADSVLPGGATPHVHTPEVKEEIVKEATCSEAGSYVEVTYCAECGEELDRSGEMPIEKIAHTLETKVENEKEATCSEEGSYDEVTYCTVCGEVTETKTITTKKLDHTPGEAQKENEVPATCTEEGSYNEVVRCKVCNEIISTTPKTTAKIAHTPGEAKRENEVPATCTEEGSYDEVVRCTECNEIISSEHKTINKTPHATVYVAEVPATYEADGCKAHYKCNSCGKLFTDATGNVETTEAELRIPKLTPTEPEPTEPEPTEPEPTEPPVDYGNRGDANGDGDVTVVDATVIQRVLAEYPAVEGYDEAAADADLDGVVDIIDVTLIQRVAAKITTFEKWDALHA